MLGNSRSLVRLASDPSYERRFCGPLEVLQELKWRSGWAVLKANLLFVFDKAEDDQPFLMLIVEDCFIEICDDNKTGKEFSFEVKYKTTGKSYTLVADSMQALKEWVSLLTISPIEYMNITRQAFLEQIDNATQDKREP